LRVGWELVAAKKQQTFAKMTRERLVRERRERKLEKKHAAAAERKARAAENEVPPFPAQLPELRSPAD
jgi:hypothetical protein